MHGLVSAAAKTSMEGSSVAIEAPVSSHSLPMTIRDFLPLAGSGTIQHMHPDRFRTSDQFRTPRKPATDRRSVLGEITNISSFEESLLSASVKQQPDQHSSLDVWVDTFASPQLVRTSSYPLESDESLLISPAPSTSHSSVRRPGRVSLGRPSPGKVSQGRSSCGSSSVMSVPASSPAASYMSRSPESDCGRSPGCDYEMQEKIGEGGFGTVHKVRDLRTDRVLAMKLIGGRSTAQREIQLMQAVDNPNVMSCCEVVNDRNVVMDLMDYDLKKLIEMKKVTFSETHVKGIALQIVRGVAAIHRQGFIHRDVTPSNILINSTTGTVKLSDFGISRPFACSGHNMTPVCTTLAYRAPEGLHGARIYTESVDVWSVGCIVAEMFERNELFPGKDAFDMIELILQGLGKPTADTYRHLWKARAKHKSWMEVCGQSWMAHCIEQPNAILRLVPSASPTAHKFLQRLIQLNPGRRPSAEHTLFDDFFKSVQTTDADSSEYVRSIVRDLVEDIDL